MRFTNRPQLAAVLVIGVLFSQLSPARAYSRNQGPQKQPSKQSLTARPGKNWSALGAPNKEANDWSKAMVESTMKRYPTAKDLGSWGYAKSLYLYGEYLVWKRTGDCRYLQYIKDWVDSHVDADGNVTNTDKDGKVTNIGFDNLDSVLPGNLLLLLFKETKEAKYSSLLRR